MSGLTFISGDENARKFLEEGASIVDFLTDPFRPCVIKSSVDTVVAINRGSVDGNFFSTFWDQHISSAAQAYDIEYMADDAVIFALPKSYVSVPKDLERYLAQNGACELVYDCKEDLPDQFISRGFAIEQELDNPRKRKELIVQRRLNVQKRFNEIVEFYIK